ncbi:MAG: TIGR00341 family protein [Anaerolineae bacterium]|nr:TIGR00341 family protein [Anaerolineae bacterium]
MTRETGEEERERADVQFGRELPPLRLAWMAGALAFSTATLGVGPYVAEIVGECAWLTFLLAGGIGGLWGITVAEMLSRPAWRTVGFYGLAQREDDSDLLTFFAGWFLLLGFVGLTGLLARVAGAYLLQALIALDENFSPPALLLTALWLVLAVLGNIAGTLRNRQLMSRLVGGLIALMVLTFLFGVPHTDVKRLAIQRAPSLLSWLSSLAMLAPIAAGIELALQARAEVRREMTVVRTTLALLLPGTMLLAGLLLAGYFTQVNVSPSAMGLTWIGRWFVERWGNAAGALENGYLAALLGVSLSTLMLTGLRCLYPMVRDGFLPSFPTSSPKVRRAGWLVTFGALSLAGGVLISDQVLLSLSAGGFLLVIGLVSLRSATTPAAALTHPLPFRPLVPLLSAIVSALLAANLTHAGLLGLFVWGGLGIILFLLYGRKAHIKAQKGQQLFVPRKELHQPEKPKEGFRVLVPVIGGSVRRMQIQIALALARRRGGEVLPLNVVVLSEQMGWQEGRRLAQEQSQLLAWSVPNGDAVGVSIYPITRLARDAAWGILETAREEKCDLIILGWKGTKGRDDARLSRVIDTVVQHAPCDVAVVKGAEMKRIGHILVPTAGGPHAPLAAALALELAETHDGRVTLLNITPPNPTEEDLAQARERLASTIEGLPESERIQFKIIPPEGNIAETILAESRRGYDLLLIGSTEVGVLDQIIFGNVPEQVAQEATIPVVLVRRYLGAARYWTFQIWHLLDRIFPDLSMEEQIALYRHLREDARPGVNYFTLIVLSSVIATLGLLQNSAAVIIGAMLVAPFMTPIMAISMALVRGDVRLLTLSLESVLKGMVASLALAILLTWIVPQPAVGSEILARTHPSLLDLVVALASGAAGAYALGRKEVAAALPGVAIAAALMPPLCAAGIGLALGNGTIAGGALLLFLANLIAIAVAGAVIFLLLGIRPPRARDTRLRRAFLISFLLLVAVSIPLVVILQNSVRQTRLEGEIRGTVQEHIAGWEGETKLGEMKLDIRARQPSVEVWLYASQVPSQEEFRALAGAVRTLLSTEADVRITVIPITLFHAGAPASAR